MRDALFRQSRHAHGARVERYDRSVIATFRADARSARVAQRMCHGMFPRSGIPIGVIAGIDRVLRGGAFANE
jgi:hypothetical protein